MSAKRIACAIESKLVEHCDAYLVIAYTTEGELVVVKNAPKELHSRALDNAVFEIMDNGGVAAIDAEEDEQ